MFKAKKTLVCIYALLFILINLNVHANNITIKDHFNDLIKKEVNNYIHQLHSKLNYKSVVHHTYYLAFRKNGRIQSEYSGKDWSKLSTVIHNQLTSKKKSYDWLEANLFFNEVDVKRSSPLLRNIYRGVKGFSFEANGRLHRYSPTQMTAQNKSFKKLLKPFTNKEIKYLKVFDAHQFFINLKLPKPTIVSAFRGNQLISPEGVTQENIKKLAQGMADWMLVNVSSLGQAGYKYWPSRNRDQQPTSNNMIRQWMATVCLGKLDEKNYIGARKKLQKNLEYNILSFYRKDRLRGIITYNNKIKLGSIALAALAIRESPFQSLYKDEEDSLNRTIHELWQPSGKFKTFYGSHLDHNHNFYPGEALLYWVNRYKKTKNPVLLKKIKASFSYYSKWHLHPRNRNPAFIPWHTQAYFELWNITRDPELKEFIFEMNDWLLNIQQWNNVKYDDVKGRFYAPGKRYGPPHASSTGVYLEGLIDAFKLAQMVKDTEREKAYRLAINRGLRSLMQLQFADDIDMFYISKKDKVKGGLRTTVYSNEIRIDNVQHGLMAVLKILESFKEEDYVLDLK